MAGWICRHRTLPSVPLPTPSGGLQIDGLAGLPDLGAFRFEPTAAGQTNWDQVDVFEPRLDLWVISSYPHFAFPNGEGIPADYHSRLAQRTPKPALARWESFRAEE